jgi:short-subunit dehydrogenase
MIQKKSGHIVIISSLAGLVPMPSAPSYSASKAAVRFYGEALRNKVAAFNIKVSVICPGFIKSRLTDANDFPMPFLMETEPAVKFMIE